ncbi:hypothetical protein [Paenibacillus illinoisensis]|uniref:hypothetical protein n=1 Tax=Paenibacillus illinoisensis TaxID=59845 RepID=UPI003D979B75
MTLNKKSSALIIALVLVVVAGTLTYLSQRSEPNSQINNVVSLSANSITFNEVDKLADFAELVVIGYATDEFVDRDHVVTAFEDGTMQSFHTNTNIKIEQVLKKPDDFPENQKELTIIEPVSLLDGTKYTADNYVELQKNDKSVIFLMKNTFGDYGLINDNLGKFSLEETNQLNSLQSFTSQELSEYEVFRNSVLEKYNLD